MINLKNSAGTFGGMFLASSRSSDSAKKSGRGTLWFESSAQRLEEQECKIHLESEPPSERPRKEPPTLPADGAEKKRKI
ncbi:MAG TPA: hypothetical protein VE093_13685 [Polyangiaceae bacterium]|jgi:hypothetical protein|nr:hypothetical protein [Polyangiaceae bacterium]